MSSELTPLLLLVVLLVVFWLVVLRPARNQQRSQQALQRSLQVGDDVVLSAGIFGTVTAIEDNQVHLEVAPGTVLRVARQVVVRRVEDEAAPADPVVADIADEDAPAAGEGGTTAPVVTADQVETADEPVPAQETTPETARKTAPKATKKKAVKKKAAEKARTTGEAPVETTGAEPASEPEDAERG